MSTESTTAPLDLAAVKKWAKGNQKRLTELKKQLEKAADLDVVVKGLDVAEPALKALRNTARKLKREFPAAKRFRAKLLREVDAEIKRYGKILGLV